MNRHHSKLTDWGLSHVEIEKTDTILDVGCGGGRTISKLAAMASDGKVHGDLPPGRGVVKFGPYLQAIKELKMDGVISIELEYSPDPRKIVEWVEEAYEGTAKLMEMAELRG